MQEREFNKMMLGQDAKWADFGEMDMKSRKVLTTGGESLSNMRDTIQRFERPIPEPTQKDIQEFIAKLRKDGVGEQKIRRIVKNKYRILVV